MSTDIKPEARPCPAKGDNILIESSDDGEVGESGPESESTTIGQFGATQKSIDSASKFVVASHFASKS